MRRTLGPTPAPIAPPIAHPGGPPDRVASLLTPTLILGLSLTLAPRAAHAEAEVPEEAAPVKISSAPPLPPLKTTFLQFGVALTGEFVASPGAMCGDANEACVLGSGGGVATRFGWRSAGNVYLGGAYELTKQDPGNLYRLATLQQLRAEVRYYVPTARDTQPFAAAGVGVAGYGNEWRVDTQGPAIFVAIGAETQLSRTNVVAIALAYRAMYFSPFTIPGLAPRPESLAQFIGLDVALEVLDPL